MNSIFILVLSLLWSQPAYLENGKCSVCHRFGVTSTVTVNMTVTCTLMACSPSYYDTTGKYVYVPDCNTCSAAMRCSRGHAVNYKRGNWPVLTTTTMPLTFDTINGDEAAAAMAARHKGPQ
jgi:hypothetical protein